MLYDDTNTSGSIREINNNMIGNPIQNDDVSPWFAPYYYEILPCQYDRKMSYGKSLIQYQICVKTCSQKSYGNLIWIDQVRRYTTHETIAGNHYPCRQ